MFAARAKEIEETGAIIFLCVSFWVPWKWSKFRGGQVVDWIGYRLSVADFRRLSEKRARWVREWVSKTLDMGFAEMKDS